MLSGVLTPLTPLQPITTLSSYGLTQSLPSPGAVAWMPWLKTGAPETTGCVPHVIIDSVRHLKSCSRRGTLIIPEWPSASFWPFLRERSSQFKSFVVDVFVLPAISDLLLEGPGQKQIYESRPSVFRGCPRFRMLALRLDFR